MKDKAIKNRFEQQQIELAIRFLVLNADKEIDPKIVKIAKQGIEQGTDEDKERQS